jgi:hypothetical protein
LIALAAAGLGLLTTGCGHPTVEISAATAPPALGAAPTSVPGVPFYVKRGMCKRETVWAEPKYTLTVNVMDGDKPAASRSLVLSRSYLIASTGTKSKDSTLEKLLENLNALAAARSVDDLSADTCPDKVAAEWEAESERARDSEVRGYCGESNLLPCSALADGEKDGDLLRLVNTASVVTEVDYEHMYYFNAKTPWIGSATADPKINADGTLSEGNATVSDQTWSTILGTIGALAGDTTSFASASAAANATVKVAKINQGPAIENKMLAFHFFDNVILPAACEKNSAPGWPLPKLAVMLAKPAPADAGDDAKPKPDPKATKKEKTPAPAETGDASEAAKTEPAITYQVTLQASVYLHDHIKEDMGLGAECVASPTGVTDGSVTITKQDETKAKDDSSAIKVSGTVTLPKASAATAK